MLLSVQYNEPESFRALNIPLGCEGDARNLAGKVLKAAGAGGRESIILEIAPWVKTYHH